MNGKKLIIALLAFALTAPIYGQGLKLGPQLGYQKAPEAEEGSLMGGAALRAKLLPMLGAEVSINYRQEEYIDGILTVRSWPVMVTGMFYPLPIAYAAVGTGWYNTTFDFDEDIPGVEDETKQKVGWHFGIGAELPAGTQMTLTGDIKYVFLNYEWDEVPGGGEPDNANFYVINVGLLFDI